MFCKNCGANNVEGVRFCANCGADMYTAAPVAMPTANYVAAPVNEPGKGFAVASLVLGIVSFFCFGIIAGILAIVFGSVAKSKGYTKPMATAGIVLGVVGLALLIITWIAFPSAIFGMFM